jgi:hypothetical protein
MERIIISKEPSAPSFGLTIESRRKPPQPSIKPLTDWSVLAAKGDIIIEDDDGEY